jgi:hypothetical protein
MASNLHQGVTHAILRHKQQPAYEQAVALPGVTVVGPEWVIYSATEGTFLRIVEVRHELDLITSITCVVCHTTYHQM